MIYLDHAATTPLDRRVLQAMLPWLDDQAHYGNPASDHALGRRARAAVEAARQEVASLLGASTDEIVWTSGATEANNLAIKGALEFRGSRGAHMVTSRIEHKAVLDTARYLETQGLRVSYLTPDADGVIGVEQVLAALRPDTALVSLMWVNNETGAINPVAELAPLLRARGVLLHVDAVQAVGKLDIDLSATPIDLLSLSAHKLYGPKGVGALFVRKRPRARLTPQMHGGGHEQGMRSGTLATHQLVGLGAACRIAASEMIDESARLIALRERLQQRLQAMPGVLLNGPAQARVAGLLNLSFAGVDGEALRACLPQLMVSSGSACSSATREPSYVLRALGRDDRLAGASLRLSLGRASSAADIDAAAGMITAAVQFLRALAEGQPRYDGTEAVLSLRAEDNVYAYSLPVWRRFILPRYGGALDAAVTTAQAEASDAASHSRLQVALCLQDGRATQARFQALGCPVLIAVGDWLAEQLQRREPAQWSQLDAAAIRAALEIDEDKAHCALVGEDVVRALMRRIGGS